MSTQHLSDEAVAAFADGVLQGHARERATRHTAECAECGHAVQVQREAAWALRGAGLPSLPLGLMDRLRDLPQCTPISALPSAIGPDGTPMLATFAPMAALAPTPARSWGASRLHRSRPIVTTAAVVALAGALTVGSAARGSTEPGEPTVAKLVNQTGPAGHAPFSVPGGVNLFGTGRP